MLTLITMIEYINSLLLLTLLGIIYYIYYKYKIFLAAITMVTNSVILDQSNNLGKDVNSEVKVIKPRKSRKKKTNTKGEFPVMAETTRNHIFSKEISQVIIAAMVLAPNFY